MSKIHEHASLSIEEIKKLPYSRQYIGGILRVKHGLCYACGETNDSEKAILYCKRCRQKHRKTLIIDWASVDWNLSDRQISKMVGITRGGVWHARNRYAPGSNTRVNRWQKVDWSLTASQIAKSIGVSVSAVYIHTKKHGINIKKARQQEAVMKGDFPSVTED